MKKVELLEKLLNEFSYPEYLKANIDLSDTIIEKLLDDPISKGAWKELTIKVSQIGKLKNLTNPYFIGYGNPDSDILFIGQEKAFSICDSPELLFLESIYHNFQWQEICKNLENKEKLDLEFDPRFPQNFFKKGWTEKDKNTGKTKNNHTHTWYKYSMFLSFFKSSLKSAKSLFIENKNLENSFFNYCFCTEFNHEPDKKTKNNKAIPQRVLFLKNEFFKSFKYVVFAAGNSIESDSVKEIFNAEKIGKYSLGKYGTNNSKERFVDFYQSKTQKIITCAQLSGSAGWQNDQIRRMSELF